jgi:hypothetical protein
MKTLPISEDISISHQSPWLWRLATHQVATLAAEPHPRWLKVEEGSLWLTRRESGSDRSDDIWLCSGESLALPAGSEWVLEAWRAARVSLLQQAPAVRRDGAASTGWWTWAARLGWLRASMPASS